MPEKSVTAWEKEWASFIGDVLELKPSVTVQDYDFTDYPTETDLDGTLRPGDAWLKGIGAEVVRKHGKYGFDHVVLLIHVDHWKSDDGKRRIWGTNYSYIYGPFNVHYCRFDKRNAANTFGTIHHEIHHSYDALVKIETGADVNQLLGVTSWDKQVTHGGKAPWSYIRWKENTDSMRRIAPLLRQAYEVRRKRHEEQLSGMKLTIANLTQQVAYLMRQKRYGKDGIKL